MGRRAGAGGVAGAARVGGPAAGAGGGRADHPALLRDDLGHDARAAGVPSSETSAGGPEGADDAGRYAAMLARLFAPAFDVRLQDVEHFEEAAFDAGLEACRAGGALLVLSATYGNGDPPNPSRAFLKHLERGHVDLDGVRAAVCGFGSTNFPRFCGAADVFAETLATRGASPICAPGKCDAVEGERTAFDAWVATGVRRGRVPLYSRRVSDTTVRRGLETLAKRRPCAENV